MNKLHWLLERQSIALDERRTYERTEKNGEGFVIRGKEQSKCGEYVVKPYYYFEGLTTVKNKLTALQRYCAKISNKMDVGFEAPELLHGTELQWRRNIKELSPLEVQVHILSGHHHCR